MHPKLEKLMEEASQIGDEELMELYVKKELEKMDSELSESDYNELINSADEDVKELHEFMKNYKNE